MSNKLRICAISKPKGFCHYYRIKWPLEELEKKGLIEAVVLDPTHPEFIKNPGKPLGDIINWANVFIFQFANPANILTKYNDLSIINKVPKLFISEFDDDITSTNPTNSHYRYVGMEEYKVKDTWMWKDNELCDHLGEYKDKTDEEKELLKFNLDRNKGRIAKIYKAVMYSDLVTVTTPELASVFEGWNLNVNVLPNYINPNYMPQGKKKPRDHVVIGWQGGSSHFNDLKMIMPALKRIKKKYKEKVKFKFMGAGFLGMYKELDADFVEWIDSEKFYDVFSEDIFDIGLIPLIDPKIDKFNNSKSNIKWLEYSYYGIPSVVSEYKPYVQHITNNNTGLLCYNQNDWYENICKLVDDPFLRMNIGKNAKNEVNLKWTIEKHAYKWYDSYINAFKNKIEHISSI